MNYVKCARCIECGHEIAAAPDITVCPKCGGLLDIIYDYDSLKQDVSKDTFARRGEPTIWRYAELLPDRKSVV